MSGSASSFFSKLVETQAVVRFPQNSNPKTPVVSTICDPGAYNQQVADEFLEIINARLCKGCFAGDSNRADDVRARIHRGLYPTFADDREKIKTAKLVVGRLSDSLRVLKSKHDNTNLNTKHILLQSLSDPALGRDDPFALLIARKFHHLGWRPPHQIRSTVTQEWKEVIEA